MYLKYFIISINRETLHTLLISRTKVDSAFVMYNAPQIEFSRWGWRWEQKEPSLKDGFQKRNDLVRSNGNTFLSANGE